MSAGPGIQMLPHRTPNPETPEWGFTTSSCSNEAGEIVVCALWHVSPRVRAQESNLSLLLAPLVFPGPRDCPDRLDLHYRPFLLLALESPRIVRGPRQQ